MTDHTVNNLAYTLGSLLKTSTSKAEVNMLRRATKGESHLDKAEGLSKVLNRGNIGSGGAPKKNPPKPAPKKSPTPAPKSNLSKEEIDMLRRATGKKSSSVDNLAYSLGSLLKESGQVRKDGFKELPYAEIQKLSPKAKDNYYKRMLAPPAHRKKIKGVIDAGKRIDKAVKPVLPKKKASREEVLYKAAALSMEKDAMVAKILGGLAKGVTGLAGKSNWIGKATNALMGTKAIKQLGQVKNILGNPQFANMTARGFKLPVGQIAKTLAFSPLGKGLMVGGGLYGASKLFGGGGGDPGAMGGVMDPRQAMIAQAMAPGMSMGTPGLQRLMADSWK